MALFMPMSATERAASRKVQLTRVRINGGGYDSNGSYWGVDQPLYHAFSADGLVDLHFRAMDRDSAKDHIRQMSPNARFYR